MRKTIVIAVLTVASVLASLLVATAPADAAGTPTSTNGPCGYTSTPDDPPARPVSLPPDPAHTPDQGIVRVVVATSQGPMILSLDRAKAPCTVNSFTYLAGKKYFDNTPCHRLTTAANFGVLQCGDPGGSGSGGPGYSFNDELDKNGKYTKGVLAMANSGPNTNGSQFFIVYKDTQLAPNYTIFGTVTKGLDVVENVAKGGTTSGEDGKPKTAISLKTVTIAK